MGEPVGFVGLGVMGAPMAARLAIKETVWGVDPRRERFAALPGVLAVELSDLAACSVVYLSLPGSAVASVVNTLAGILRPGSLVIDLSTGLPAVCRASAERLALRGVDYADAPVSGGEAGAVAGTLAIMVGASDAVFERCRPCLAPLGATVVRMGGVGSGAVAKLVNNMIVGVTFSVAAEGFALAAREGVDAAVLHQVLRGGWAASPVLDVTAPAVAAREYRPGGTVTMIQHDLESALKLGRDSGCHLPMTEAAQTLFAQAAEAGWGAQSQPAVYELWAGGRP